MPTRPLSAVSSVEAAIIYTLEPVLGATFAWALLGERLGAKGLAGAAIIVASSLATQMFGGAAEQPASAASLASCDGASPGSFDGEPEGEEAAQPRPKKD